MPPAPGPELAVPAHRTAHRGRARGGTHAAGTHRPYRSRQRPRPRPPRVRGQAGARRSRRPHCGTGRGAGSGTGLCGWVGSGAGAGHLQAAAIPHQEEHGASGPDVSTSAGAGHPAGECLVAARGETRGALLLKARQAMAAQVTCCAPLARTVGDGGFERTLLPHRIDPCQAGGACHAGDVREQAPSRVPPSLSCPPCTRSHPLSHKCGYESHDMTHITPVSPSSHLRYGRLYVPC